MPSGKLRHPLPADAEQTSRLGDAAQRCGRIPGAAAPIFDFALELGLARHADGEHLRRAQAGFRAGAPEGIHPNHRGSARIRRMERRRRLDNTTAGLNNRLEVLEGRKQPPEGPCP